MWMAEYNEKKTTISDGVNSYKTSWPRCLAGWVECWMAWLGLVGLVGWLAGWLALRKTFTSV